MERNIEQYKKRGFVFAEHYSEKVKPADTRRWFGFLAVKKGATEGRLCLVGIEVSGV